MFERIRRPVDSAISQAGFSLIEFLVVLVIVGILFAIAIPSYIGFRDRANDAAAQSNVRAALPAVETYVTGKAPTRGGGAYTGMTLAKLRAIEPSVELDGDPVVTATTFCVQSTVGSRTWSLSGPGDGAPVERGC